MLSRTDYHPHRPCETEAHMVSPARRVGGGLSNSYFSWNSASINEVHSPSKKRCIPLEDGSSSCQRCSRHNIPVSFSSLLTFMMSQHGLWTLSAYVEIWSCLKHQRTSCAGCWC